MKALFTLLMIAVTAAGCDKLPARPGSPDETPTVVEDGLPLQFETAHFRCFCLDSDTTAIRLGVMRAEAEYDRVLADLNVSTLPVVQIKIWSDLTAFYDEMAEDAGMVYEGATGYLSGYTEFRLLSPRVTPDEYVHEFAHVVSLALNPTISNNPRWLWETVACYEAGQYVHPATLSYVIQNNMPTLDALSTPYNSSAHQIHQLGFLLGTFIVDEWSHQNYVDLVLQNGNISAVLGISTSQFEQRFYEYLISHYQIDSGD